MPMSPSALWERRMARSVALAYALVHVFVCDHELHSQQLSSLSLYTTQVINTGPNKLDSSANDFERGHADTFMLKCKDVGEFKRVMVRLFVCEKGRVRVVTRVQLVVRLKLML